MGSYQEIKFFDNPNGLSHEKASGFIKDSVSDQLPSFQVAKEYDDSHGYWHIFY